MKMLLVRKYIRSLGIGDDKYPDEILLELLVESHKALRHTNDRVTLARRKFLGKQLLKYLGIE